MIALVGEEATCKYYYPEIDRIRLVPANDTMTDIIVRKDRLALDADPGRRGRPVPQVQLSTRSDYGAGRSDVARRSKRNTRKGTRPPARRESRRGPTLQRVAALKTPLRV